MNKVAYFGVMTALAMIFSYVEVLIPISLGVPGIKLGLANLVIVIMLYKYGWRDAFLLSTVRILLSGFMFGSLSMIIYSFAGRLLSLLIMTILKRDDGYSIIGVSIGGAVFHNIGQLSIAMLMLESYHIIHYLPVLLIAGVVTGFLIGILCKELLKRLSNIL